MFLYKLRARKKSKPVFEKLKIEEISDFLIETAYGNGCYHIHNINYIKKLELSGTKVVCFFDKSLKSRFEKILSEK